MQSLVRGLAVVFACTCSSRLLAQDVQTPDSTRLSLARSLLVLTGAGAPASAIVNNLITQQRSVLPGIPPAMWDTLDARFRRFLPTVADTLALEYAGRFSAKELREIVRFYESPVGRHLLAEQPALMLIGAQLGQQWAAGMFNDVRVRARIDSIR